MKEVAKKLSTMDSIYMTIEEKGYIKINPMFANASVIDKLINDEMLTNVTNDDGTVDFFICSIKV